MTGTRLALKVARGTGGAGAVAIGARAHAARVLRAVDVARRGLAPEVTATARVAVAVAVGTFSRALFVVATAVDVARRGGTLKVALIPSSAHAVTPAARVEITPATPN